MTIIPAIDIIEGKCVRLSQGDFSSQTLYGEDPLAMARLFASYGLHRLHLVDLDGARSSRVSNWRVLEQIASGTGLSIDFSGGIQSREDVQKAFQLGAEFIAVGSMAVKNPELIKEWIMEFGPGKFILGADVKDDKIMINGWATETDLEWKQLLEKYSAFGLQRVFCTDVRKDGLLKGPAFDLYDSIMADFPALKLIASGGISSLSDLMELKKIGCDGAIVGKAIYEKKISLEELRSMNELC